MAVAPDRIKDIARDAWNLTVARVLRIGLTSGCLFVLLCASGIRLHRDLYHNIAASYAGLVTGIAWALLSAAALARQPSRRRRRR